MEQDRRTNAYNGSREQTNSRTALSHLLAVTSALRASAVIPHGVNGVHKQIAVVAALGFLSAERTEFESATVQRYFGLLQDTDPKAARRTLKTLKAAAQTKGISASEVEKRLGISDRKKTPQS